MIHVYYDNNGFIVRGHADFSAKGTDIVCAAVSSLAQSVLITLEKNDFIEEQEVEEGYMRIVTNKHNSLGELVIDVLVYGAKAIALEYPNHVKVQYLGGLKDE